MSVTCQKKPGDPEAAGGFSLYSISESSPAEPFSYGKNGSIAKRCVEDTYKLTDSVKLFTFVNSLIVEYEFC